MDAPRVSLDCATGHTSKKKIVTLNKGQNLKSPIVVRQRNPPCSFSRGEPHSNKKAKLSILTNTLRETN